jgi:hypothetical protein
MKSELNIMRRQKNENKDERERINRMQSKKCTLSQFEGLLLYGLATHHKHAAIPAKLRKLRRLEGEHENTKIGKHTGCRKQTEITE